MNACVELLADDVWAAEDDKTGFLSFGVDSSDQLYLEKRPIFLPMVPMSTINQKYDKWGQLRKLNKSKYEIFDEWSKYYVWLYPLWKNSKNQEMSIK